MKHLKAFEPFNEEIDLKKGLLYGGIALAGAVGVNNYIQNYGKASVNDEEILGGEKFVEYSISVVYESFDLRVSEDGIYTAYWTTEEGSGKSKRTVSHTCITVPNGTKVVNYDTKFFGGCYASIKDFSGSKNINLSDLSVYEETKTYTVLKGGFFSPFDYIIINKGHTDGEEFEMPGSQIAAYFCYKISEKVYLFGTKGLGGKFGGGGSGGTYK